MKDLFYSANLKVQVSYFNPQSIIRIALRQILSGKYVSKWKIDKILNHCYPEPLNSLEYE